MKRDNKLFLKDIYIGLNEILLDSVDAALMKVTSQEIEEVNFQKYTIHGFHMVLIILQHFFLTLVL